MKYKSLTWKRVFHSLVKNKHRKDLIVTILLLFISLNIFLVIPLINNQTKLSYIPRAQEVDDGQGVDSPGTSGPISSNKSDYNCDQSTNTCAEDIPCGYCRQHDSDCKMYLCVGPNWDRGNLPTYAYSVYMPHPACPKPSKLKVTCKTIVSTEETVKTEPKKLEEKITAKFTYETTTGETVYQFSNGRFITY